MSKRMSNEKARENIKKLKECATTYRNTVADAPHKEVSVVIGDKQLYLNDEMLESLDIAIESLDNEWVDVRDRFPSDDEIAKDTEFIVKAENSKGNLINTVITCDKADKENREWTFGRYEREDNKPIFTVYEVVAWKKIEPYGRKKNEK